jgi:hypothetical protein
MERRLVTGTQSKRVKKLAQSEHRHQFIIDLSSITCVGQHVWRYIASVTYQIQ